ncbi:hypothetical protein [Leuconostoc lactis]
MATGSGKTDVMAADMLYFYHELAIKIFFLLLYKRGDC